MSLCHLAIVAKFLDDKPRTSLKKWIRTVSDFINLIQFHLVSPILAKFSGVESERTVSKFRKRKRNFCVVLTYSIKQAREKFMSQSCNDNYEMYNIRDERAKLFCLLTFLLFCRSRYRRRRRRLYLRLFRSRHFASMVTCGYLPTLSGLGPRLCEPHRT